MRTLQFGEGAGPGLTQDRRARPPLCRVQSSGRVSGQTMEPHVLSRSPSRVVGTSVRLSVFRRDFWL